MISEKICHTRSIAKNLDSYQYFFHFFKFKGRYCALDCIFSKLAKVNNLPSLIYLLYIYLVTIIIYSIIIIKSFEQVEVSKCMYIRNRDYTHTHIHTLHQLILLVRVV